MNIDKEILLTCPDECGQIAVPCSIRMILDNQAFFCESCGCEFQGTVFPGWLDSASHLRLSREDEQLHKNMQVLYSHLYAGGAKPSSSFLEELLQQHPEYWRLFPANVIPVKVVLKLLLSEASFAEGFDFSALSSPDWLELLLKAPSFAAKCPWKKFSRYIVETSRKLPDSFLRNSEVLFASSGLAEDKRFSPDATEEKQALYNPIAFACKMGWKAHLNWNAFNLEDVFAAFKAYPMLLKEYPFTRFKLEDFDWKRYGASNWDVAIGCIPQKSPLLKIHSLIMGKNVDAILAANPQWEKYCCWNEVSSAEWVKMVIASSKWLSSCPWGIFNSREWLAILKVKPEYASRCQWQLFNCAEWLELFKLDIDYARYCDWNKFSSRNWVDIIRAFPALASHCPWQSLPANYLISLFRIDRKYVSKCTRWDKFNANAWMELFEIDYALFEGKCDNWNMFSSRQWCVLLKKYPQLSRHCNWKKITSDVWKDILFNDLIAEVAARSMRSRKTSFAYREMQHPEYLAIHNLIHGQGVAEALRRYPDYGDKYLQWDKISANEWLHCLAENPRLASRCTKKHWGKILVYIRNLPSEIQHSAKQYYTLLWEKRLEILEAANRLEITQLPAEDFYALVDFMDWEWDRHFSWEAVGHEQVLSLARKRPDFMEKYGWERISDDEIRRLLLSSQDFTAFCIEKAKGTDAIASRMRKAFDHDTITWLFLSYPLLSKKLMPFFSLTLKDLKDFRYYGSKYLRCKVAFYQMFFIMLLCFALGWLWLCPGECGYLAFAREHQQQARLALYVYVGYACVFSFMLAKTHDFCGGPRLSKFLGAIHAIVGVLLFKHTFFLTSLAQRHFRHALYIYAVYVVIMFFVRKIYRINIAKEL
ncbi:MAG: hypothetical protein IJS08_13645 [Victivallales bacterium]|nr:hypothetical protein [Victivallales bacterium]